MGLIAILVMIAAGGAIAVGIMIVIAVAERNGGGDPGGRAALDRTRIAGSILFQLLVAGGMQPAEALRELRRVGVVSPVTAGIDIASWADRYGQSATPQQREWLLETAVRLVASPASPVPLRQYALLLDLSFSLGFHTDALARLREQYGFDYIDHAKDSRPREADRGGGAMALFVRDERDTETLLSVLGIEGTPSRQAIISAYRRMAAQIHPDRVHGQADEVRSEAAARFIEITRAYEALMVIYRD